MQKKMHMEFHMISKQRQRKLFYATSRDATTRAGGIGGSQRWLGNYLVLLILWYSSTPL